MLPPIRRIQKTKEQQQQHNTYFSHQKNQVQQQQRNQQQQHENIRKKECLTQPFQKRYNNNNNYVFSNINKCSRMKPFLYLSRARTAMVLLLLLLLSSSFFIQIVECHYDQKLHHSQSYKNNNNNNNNNNQRLYRIQSTVVVTNNPFFSQQKSSSSSSVVSSFLSTITKFRGGGGGSGDSDDGDSTNENDDDMTTDDETTTVTDLSKTTPTTTRKAKENNNKKSITTTKEKKKKATTKKTSSLSNKKMKKKKKNKSNSSSTNKSITNTLLKETDAAEALGDAIRNRADQIRRSMPTTSQQQQQSNHNHNHRGVPQFHPSIQSIGWSLGASDQDPLSLSTSSSSYLFKELVVDNNNNINNMEGGGANGRHKEQDEKEKSIYDLYHNTVGGGVKASPSAVIAHYFLKSHGGAHAVQCICSLFSLLSGILSLLIVTSTTTKLTTTPNHNNNNHKLFLVQLMLLKRCFTFAMMKHITGLLAACFIATKSISNMGYRQTKIWLEQLILDPVCQYIFYCSCLLIWLPNKYRTTNQDISIVPTITTTSTSTISTNSINTILSSIFTGGGVPVWQSYKIISLFFMGPVVLRELISTLFVLSDVIILWSTAQNGIGGQHLTENDENDENDTNRHNNDNNKIMTKLGRSVLTISRLMIHSIMCLLVTPKKWKTANAIQKQEILAKITSKCSLFMELVVGTIMVIDSIWSITLLIFGSGSAAGSSSTMTTTTTSMIQNDPSYQSFLSIGKRLFCTRLYLHFLWVRKRKITKFVTDLRGGASTLPFHLLDILLHPTEQMGLPVLDRKSISSTRMNRSSTSRSSQYHEDSSKLINKERNQNVDHQSTTSKIEIDSYNWKDYVRIAFNFDDP